MYPVWPTVWNELSGSQSVDAEWVQFPGTLAGHVLLCQLLVAVYDIDLLVALVACSCIYKSANHLHENLTVRGFTSYLASRCSLWTIKCLLPENQTLSTDNCMQQQVHRTRQLHLSTKNEAETTQTTIVHH